MIAPTMDPRIRYATTSDGLAIAFWSIGEGPAVVDMGQPPVNHTRLEWQIPEIRAWYERFARHHQFARFDARGTGLSERDIDAYTVEGQVRDLEAVVDALGLERFTLLGGINSAPGAVRYAAEHPERLDALILWCGYSRGKEFYDDPGTQALRQTIERDWGMFAESASRSRFSWTHDEHASRVARLLRETVTPRVMALIMDSLSEIDVTPLLASVRVPALVMQRNDRGVEVARRLAAPMADARVVVFEGGSAAMYLEDADEIWATIAEFLGDEAETSGAGVARSPSRTTAVILFTDIVDSTALTERLGDAAFRERARACDEKLRAAVRAHGGTPVEGKLLGDGILALFTSAGGAIDAARACIEGACDAGVELHAGIHAGDVISEGGNVYGGAVNIAARISALSVANEVLVSATARDLARTSAGVDFDDRGTHDLKGVGEPVRIFAVKPKA